MRRPAHQRVLTDDAQAETERGERTLVDIIDHGTTLLAVGLLASHDGDTEAAITELRGRLRRAITDIEAGVYSPVVAH